MTLLIWRIWNNTSLAKVSLADVEVKRILAFEEMSSARIRITVHDLPAFARSGFHL